MFEVAGDFLDLAGEGVVGEQSDYIDITIDAENHLYLNSRPVGMDDLPGRVLELRGGEMKPVFINGDQSAELGLAIELLDLLKKSGIEEVSFSCKTSTP